MEFISTFSDHLFWDVDKTALDPGKHAKYIIKSVLLYGHFEDWKSIRKIYGLERIIDESITIKELDRKTVSFLALIADVPKEKFLCYTTKQSTPKHWNF